MTERAKRQAKPPTTGPSATIEACHAAFGVRVRIVREILDLTQADLAERVGLERASVTNIEAGRQRVSLDAVERFARALGTTPKNLMKGIWW